MLALLLTSCLLIGDDELGARLDLDGDGVARPLDCADDDPTVGAIETFYVDLDGDGYGIDATVEACEQGPNATRSGDCDDNDPAIHPGAVEQCNQADDDCDDEVDEDVVPETWYLDGDGDDFGNPTVSVTACEQPDNHVDNGDDCDDNDPGLSPRTPWYPDDDGDLWGAETGVVHQCEQPKGFVRIGADCDDSDPMINPYADEVCDDDDVDEDCDGQADDADDSVIGEFDLYYADVDGDGFGDPDVTSERCDASAEWVENGRDCDVELAEVGDCGWAALKAGTDASCGLSSSGALECWGGEVASGVPPGSFQAVDLHNGIACAIDTDGMLSCWGRADDIYALTDPPGGSHASVCVGTTQACALGVDGVLTCWGVDYSGGPAAPEGEVFAHLDCTSTWGCAVDAEGAVRCWGVSTYKGDYEMALPDPPYVDTALSSTHICGRGVDGSIDCIAPASADYGQVVSSAGPYQQVAAATWSTLALAEDGSLSYWGYDLHGVSTLPTEPLEQIDAGRYHACGVTETGEGLCWGCEPDGLDACEVPEPR